MTHSVRLETIAAVGWSEKVTLIGITPSCGLSITATTPHVTTTCPSSLMDILNDLHEALTAAGVDPVLVRRVLADTRRMYGGGSVYVRKRDAHRQASEVRALVRQGLSFRATARELGLADGTVRRIISRG